MLEQCYKKTVSYGKNVNLSLIIHKNELWMSCWIGEPKDG